MQIEKKKRYQNQTMNTPSLWNDKELTIETEKVLPENKKRAIIKAK